VVCRPAGLYPRRLRVVFHTRTPSEVASSAWFQTYDAANVEAALARQYGFFYR
jgi:hypothetical protein